MPMQAVQGMPVQVGSPKTGSDPVKSDPADFLNVLAALLMPSPQPLPADNPDLAQNTEEKVAASPLITATQLTAEAQLSYPEPVIPAQRAVPEVVPGNADAVLLTEEVPQVQELQGLTNTQTPAAEQEVLEILTQTAAPELRPDQKEIQRIEGKDGFPAVYQFAAKAPMGAEEPQLKISEPEKKIQSVARKSAQEVETVPIMHSQRVENLMALKGKVRTDIPESLNLDKATTETQEAGRAVGSKTESGQAGLDKEMGLKAQEELPQTESNSGTQEIRPFTEYLLKDIVPSKEIKTIPAAAEFKVPSQELAQEFPRIIESQVRNAKGEEISRDIIIHLEPKELGKLTLKLTAQEGIITVKILTEHIETRNLVEAGLTNLRQSFSEQGIKYGRMDVELGGQSLYQQQQQPQQQQHQSPMYMTKQGTLPGKQWQEVSYYPEDSNVVAGSRLKSSGAVDYRV